MRAKARLRRWLQRLRQPKHLLLAILVAGLAILYGLGMASSVDKLGDSVRRYRAFAGPFLLYMVGIWAWYSARHGALVFSPAEVHFLFPAPVTTRALLLVHLIVRMLKATSTAVLFALFFRAPGSSYFQTLFGWVVFILTAVLLQVFIDTRFMGLPRRTRQRRANLAGLLVIAAAVAALGRAYLEDGGFSLAVFRYLVLPVEPFLDLIFATEVSTAAGPLLIAASLMTVFAVFIFRTRRDVRESAQAASATAQRRLDRIRGGNVLADQPRDRTGGAILPLPPRLGGAGIHAWRQLSVLLRSRRSYATLVVVAIFVATLQVVTRQTRQAESAAIGLIMVLTLVGPFYVQCDFRSDFAVLPWLRSLPTRPTMLALGQMLSSALILYVFQFFLTFWILFVAHGGERLAWIAVFVALPVFNLLQLSVWNGAHLLFPTQLIGQGGTPSPTQIVRWYLTIAAVIGLLGAALVAAIAVGIGTHALLQLIPVDVVWSRTLGGLMGFAALCAVTCWSVVAVGRIFTAIDPSRDLA
jgi:hypothetical protein